MKKIYIPKIASLSLGLAFSALPSPLQADAAPNAQGCYQQYNLCLKASRGDEDKMARCEKAYQNCLNRSGVSRAAMDHILGNAFAASESAELDAFLSNLE